MYKIHIPTAVHWQTINKQSPLSSVRNNSETCKSYETSLHPKEDSEHSTVSSEHLNDTNKHIDGASDLWVGDPPQYVVHQGLPHRGEGVVPPSIRDKTRSSILPSPSSSPRLINPSIFMENIHFLRKIKIWRIITFFEGKKHYFVEDTFF